MGEAAMVSGRKAILIERDDEFFKKGSIRLANLEDKLENNVL